MGGNDLVIAGIDPGQSGGIALTQGTKLTAFARMPTMKVGGKTHVDARALHDLLTKDTWPPPDAIVIEQVHAMPRQGVSSTFAFGAAFGSACAAAYITGRRVEFVTPAAWKKALGLSSDKRASLDMARRLWPEAVDWSVLANDGIAEAALIAEWYRRGCADRRRVSGSRLVPRVFPH